MSLLTRRGSSDLSGVHSRGGVCTPAIEAAFPEAAGWLTRRRVVRTAPRSGAGALPPGEPACSCAADPAGGVRARSGVPAGAEASNKPRSSAMASGGIALPCGRQRAHATPPSSRLKRSDGAWRASAPQEMQRSSRGSYPSRVMMRQAAPSTTRSTSRGSVRSSSVQRGNREFVEPGVRVPRW